MDDEVSCTVALLHDVIEDTNLAFADLEKIFPAQVVDIVRLLTHDENIDYFDYIWEIKTRPCLKNKSCTRNQVMRSYEHETI